MTGRPDDTSTGATDRAAWWRRDADPDVVAERSRVQVAIILKAFEDAGVPVASHTGEAGFVDFLYDPGVVLTRDADAGRVHAALGLAQPPVKNDEVDPVAGLTRVRLPAGRDALAVLDELDAALGAGVATPDHVLHVCPLPIQVTTWCMATEPVPGGASEFAAAPVDDLADGSRSLVAVVDTGARLDVIEAAGGLLAGVTGEPEADTVGHYTGHGTFIAGVVRTYAPRADVRLTSTFSVGGAVFESVLARELGRVLDWAPDVIDISAGTRTRGNQPLLALQVFWEQRLSQVGGTVLVAAAGNDGDRVPFWPAAFPWAVSVGALDQAASEPDAQRAGFSNYGSWVDLYADGVDIVSAYPTGPYTYREPPRTDEQADFSEGAARWSGTSFAAPQVAGLVAARMTWSGESGRAAAESLVGVARDAALARVGAVVDARIGARPADRGVTPS